MGTTEIYPRWGSRTIESGVVEATDTIPFLCLLNSVNNALSLMQGCGIDILWNPSVAVCSVYCIPRFHLPQTCYFWLQLERVK